MRTFLFLLSSLLLILSQCTQQQDLAQANALLSAGDYLAARAIYSGIVKHHPESPVAHYGLGMSWCAEAMYKANLGMEDASNWYPAIYHMTVAVNRAPNDARFRHTLAVLHFNLGTVYKKQGRADEAIRRLEQATMYDTTLIKVFNLLGALYHEKHDFDKAEYWYRKALDEQPSYAMAHFNMGAIAWAQGEFDSAASAFERASQLDSDNVLYQTWLRKARQKAVIGNQ